jgi:hypothetical protein
MSALRPAVRPSSNARSHICFNFHPSSVVLAALNNRSISSNFAVPMKSRDMLGESVLAGIDAVLTLLRSVSSLAGELVAVSASELSMLEIALGLVITVVLRGMGMASGESETG